MESRTVYVKNVSTKATSDQVNDFFSFCGKIEHIDLIAQEDGTQKAEIVFGTEEAARTACLLSNALIQDQPIFVYQKEDSKIQHPGDPLKKLADEQEVVTEAKGTATAVINSLLAAGYKLGEEIKKKALEYDARFGISQKIQDTATVIKDKTVEVATIVKDKTVETAQNIKESTVNTAHVIDEKLHLTERATAVKDKTVEVASAVKDRTVEAASAVKDRTVEAAMVVDEKLHVSETVGAAKLKTQEAIGNLTGTGSTTVIEQSTTVIEPKNSTAGVTTTTIQQS
jgi:hypothetical protein